MRADVREFFVAAGWQPAAGALPARNAARLGGGCARVRQVAFIPHDRNDRPLSVALNL
jgi:hypothetical protein